MGEYTPTTEEVRSLWWHHILEGMASNEVSLASDWKEERALAQFDRWLAAHDAEVREECAKVADAEAKRWYPTTGRWGIEAATSIARTIRALGGGSR